MSESIIGSLLINNYKQCAKEYNMPVVFISHSTSCPREPEHQELSHKCDSVTNLFRILKIIKMSASNS